MQEKIEIEMYYQNEAKGLVDILFDTNLFRTDITRDGIQGVEDLIAYYLQSHAKTAKRLVEWSAKFEKMGITKE